jgi:hypothetical protein
MFCVPAANNQRNESLPLYPAQQVVTKSDSFPLMQMRGDA